MLDITQTKRTYGINIGFLIHSFNIFNCITNKNICIYSYRYHREDLFYYNHRIPYTNTFYMNHKALDYNDNKIIYFFFIKRSQSSHKPYNVNLVCVAEKP